jgi:hypothetical protein
VLAAYALLPNPWPAWSEPDLEKSLQELPPIAPLTDKQIEALTGARTKAAAALGEARLLKDMPRGRYAMVRGPDGIPGSEAHNHKVRAVRDLLAYDLMVRQQEGDADAALESCRSLVNLVHAYGDASDLSMQLQRIELRFEVCRHIERTLARLQPSPASLAALERLVKDEESQPLLLHGMRGQRVLFHEILEAARDGRMNSGGMPTWATRGLANNIRAPTLRKSTEMVEIARQPDEAAVLELQHALPQADEGPYLARVYIWPKIHKHVADLTRSHSRSQAEFRCTIAALAAERFRLQRGDWPDSLARLVPAFLDAVPVDPYDGRPLRYLRLADGVVVYSIGRDRTDDHGKLDRLRPGTTGTDLGVQLWDAEQRR